MQFGNHVIVAENTVKKVIISDTVTMLRAVVFSRLAELTAIEVSDAHPTLTTVDGVLFNKDCSELICYPQGKAAATYVIPQTVNSIYDGAFGYAQLDYIVIPENVDMIGREAFAHSALSRVDFVSFGTISLVYDENQDFRCDYCGAYLQVTCSCNCHKDGILGFFYKLTRFFWIIFKINQECGCGRMHY